MTMAAKGRDYGVFLTVESPDLKKAADSLLKAAQGRLMGQVAENLHGTTDELVTRVRKGVAKIPSWDLYGTSLRARLAANVEGRTYTASAQAGVRVLINPSGLPAGLPAAMDSSRRGTIRGRGAGYVFRHPVWGHKDRWVSQGAYPYFRANLRRQRKVTDTAVKAAVDKVIAEIADY